MSIQTLPDELLLHIFNPFSEIQDHDDPFVSGDILRAQARENIKSLASLSKVCLRWHRIIEPILYCTFTKPDNNGVQKHETGYFKQAKPKQTLRLFLRTIIEQPHLARNITTLFLGSWVETARQGCQYGPGAIAASPPDSSLRQGYIKALEELERFDGSLTRSRYAVSNHIWSGSGRCDLPGDETSELALLLLLAVNLRVLHLAQMLIVDDWRFVGLDEHMQATSHLRKIELGTVQEVLEVYDYRFRTLMTLPNLKTLILVN